MKPHTVRAIAILSLAFAFIFAGAARAQEQSEPQRGPSTPEERARAVKVAHELEDDPLGPDAKDNRAWVIQWIIDIPDITVEVCFDYFGELPDPPRGHSTEITRQMVISSAAFMIEHPDKAKDEQAVALAGLLGALKSYQAILKQDPTARWPAVDKLVMLRDQDRDKLDSFVADTRKECEENNQEEPPPGTVRTFR